MRKYYAKLWLKKYIEHNADKFGPEEFSTELDRKVKNLSHRVFKSHGARGHMGRQEIRNELWEYAVMELQRHHQMQTPKPPKRKTLLERLHLVGR